MPLEQRIRFKALAFGMGIVTLEIVAAGLLHWWQTAAVAV